MWKIGALVHYVRCGRSECKGCQLSCTLKTLTLEVRCFIDKSVAIARIISGETHMGIDRENFSFTPEYVAPINKYLDQGKRML